MGKVRTRSTLENQTNKDLNRIIGIDVAACTSNCGDRSFVWNVVFEELIRQCVAFDNFSDQLYAASIECEGVPTSLEAPF